MGSTADLRRNLLRDFMNCEFPNLPEMYPDGNIKGSEHYNYVVGNFVFRYKIKRLCKPPFCENDYSADYEL